MQVSIQSPDPAENDRIAGVRSFEKKLAAARAARELGFPLTINCVLHRQNLDRIEEILALAEELDAQRLELANTQYYGWAVAQPGARSCRRARSSSAARRRCSASASASARRITVLWVLPDCYEDLPEAVHGRLGPDHDPRRARTARRSRARPPRPSPA